MILVAAAMWAESLPIGLAMTGRRVLGRHIVLGTLGGAQVALLRCGVGERSGARVAAAITQLVAGGGVKPSWVLSVGTCGSLRDTLPIGSLVCAEQVLDTRSGVSRPARILYSVQPCTVLTVPEPVFCAARRARLSPLGQVCEMEASAVQLAAGALPFSALKVVSDMAGAHEASASKADDSKAGDPRDRPVTGMAATGRAAMLRFQRRAAELTEQVLVAGLIEAIQHEQG